MQISGDPCSAPAAGWVIAVPTSGESGVIAAGTQSSVGGSSRVDGNSRPRHIDAGRRQHSAPTEHGRCAAHALST